MFKYTIGIDEAGRGPLAGPVAVGVACVPIDFDWALLPGVTDSKKLSEKQREEIFLTASQLQTEGKIAVQVSLVGAHSIDRDGIVSAIRTGMARSLRRVGKDASESKVLLDGGLRAPRRFFKQETIIKGDQKEQVIGLASIAAKVTRDRYMVRKAEESALAPYDFKTHKGYGTKAHRAAIVKHGLSPLHRATFCRFYTEK